MKWRKDGRSKTLAEVWYRKECAVRAAAGAQYIPLHYDERRTGRSSREHIVKTAARLRSLRNNQACGFAFDLDE